ncbi:MAG: hypothetical protein AB8C84_05650 [Oligoflexales bacterium]
MSYRVGDPLFGAGGVPGRIIAQDKKTHTHKVDRSLEEVQKGFRHGYLKGLAPEAREDFYEIMDDVKSHDDVRERIAVLKNEVEERQTTADAKDLRFIGYLKAELAHLMFSHHVNPRVYDVSASQAP